MNVIESLRSEVVTHELNKINEWPQRRKQLLSVLPSTPSANDIRMLGEHLSDVFQLEGLTNNRTQAGLSGGGSVWTALVGYFLNIGLAGTDAIALNGKFLPTCIKDALKVTHSSASATKLNSDN